MHALTRRIRMLEEITPPDPPCASCGYPRKQVATVTTHDGDPVSRCPTCNRLLDEGGLPLAHTGVHVIFQTESAIRR
jgi:hypothetical protein